VPSNRFATALIWYINNSLSHFDDNSISHCYRVFIIIYTHVTSNIFNETRYLKILKEIKILKKKKKGVLSEYKHEMKTHVKCFMHLNALIFGKCVKCITFVIHLHI